MANFSRFMRKKFNGFFGYKKWLPFLLELQIIGRLLVFIAIVALFMYAFICPNFWIIFILFLLFLALLALCIF
ncbi:MAG: hypothetical protein AAGU27_08965 [Dehalobacterium sp.]